MMAMSGEPLLTIAIPTYNRSRFLSLGLEILTRQISDDPGLLGRVDVLVVDNASGDDTAAVASAFRERHPFVSYHRNPENLGIDGNILRCSQLARGRYVQFLSDDDIVLPGGIRAVVERIERHPDAEFFFLNLRPFADDYRTDPLLPSPLPGLEDLRFESPSGLVAHCWIYMTFVSSFCFRRTAWSAGGRHETYLGTEIYLSYALFDLLARGAPSIFVAQPIIGMRCHYGGNFRLFRALAQQWRHLLLEQAPAIGFDRAVMVETFRRSIRYDLPPRVVDHRLHHGELDPASRSWIVDSTRDFACAWWSVLPVVFAPGWLLKAAHRSARLIRKMSHRGSTAS
jgi:glycosyltransferase involved in cell wall biosynthesis